MVMRTTQTTKVPRPWRPGYQAILRVLIVLVCLASITACQMNTTSSGAELPTATAAPPTAAPTAAATPHAAAPPASATATSNTSATDFSSVIRAVAQQVKPAVVQITNEQVQIDQFNQSFTVPAGVGS